jgi:hypothetical protein
MKLAPKDQAIAWNIAYQIMIHSLEPLVLFMLHPGGEQYNCLSILQDDGRKFSPIILITLKGSSIRVRDITISPYPELYKKNKIALINNIAERSGIRISDTPINNHAAISYLMELAALDNIEITSAWYDGSYNFELERAAKDFPYYPVKNETDYRYHIPWWVISERGNTIAMVNLETEVQVSADGSCYDLKTQNNEAMKGVRELVLKKEFEAVIDETQGLLKQKNEWVDRYAIYAEKIDNNMDFIKTVRRSFREWSPLKVYLNTTSAQNAKKAVRFELRYLGQTVAKLTGKEDGRHILSTKGFEKTNLRDFDCDIKLSAVAWDGKEAAKFRSFFRNRASIRNNTSNNSGNEEHRLESLLLTEFSKTKGKLLRGIKPMMIGGLRFPMPTPISASNHNILKYSGIRGGGIDILTRTGTGGRATNLCIMELKDENIKSEPPRDAMKQAVAYATFIRELLRSNSGEAWWKLFGFGREVPTPLVLFAACVMPSSTGNDYSFKDVVLDIDGDFIKLHYLYFTEANNQITSVDTSLTY